MKLIHFPGLNCYHDCVITLAEAFGLDYLPSFSGLWAEDGLRYDPICKVFLTRRMPTALEAMGLKLEPPNVTGEERERAWAQLPVGGFALAGMDGCLTPWNPLYQLHHGPHYFIVQKTRADPQTCFDPTYGLNGQLLDSRELVGNAYALIPARKVEPSFLPGEHDTDPILAQAREVITRHPAALHGFLEQADSWFHGTGEAVLLPAKYADALLTNRVLYRRYLEERHPGSEAAALFQEKGFYEAWQAVKHGFYKAALKKWDPAAFDDVCGRLTALFHQETAWARQLLALRQEGHEKET